MLYGDQWCWKLHAREDAMFEFLHHDLEQRAELQGISMADVLDLPEPLSTAIKRMVRGRSVLLSEFAADLGLSIDEARALGAILAEKGYLIYAERKHSDEEIYRARFARVQGRNLPVAIWESLDT
jgi:hypothetical protein